MPPRRTIDRCLASFMFWCSGFVAAMLPFAWTMGHHWEFLGTCILSFATLVAGIWGVWAPWERGKEEDIHA